MPDEDAMLMQVVILGTDALIAARPAEPVQLWLACQSLGFDFVAPVTWGEELIASWLAGKMADSGSRSAVVASCPLVDDRLDSWTVQPPVLRTVAPPVACARYLRAAFHPRQVHVTYVGACPGAESGEIDAQLLPDGLFARFIEAGVEVARQPRHFDGQIPPERARYASLPGGAPAVDWLAHRGVRLVEAAPLTIDTVAQAGHERVMIDLATSCHCACARNRVEAARLEPPRTFVPVVMNLRVPVGEGDTVEPEPAPEPETVAAPISTIEPAVSPIPSREHRAMFAENGLSAGEADPLPLSLDEADPLPLPIPHSLATTLDPW